MDVDSLFNIFLANYLRIVYTSFPLRKIIERGKSRHWITTGIKTSCNSKRQLYLLIKVSNDNLIKYYKQYCRILVRVITEAKKGSKYNNQIINSTNKMKTTWNIIKSETNRLKGHTVITKILLTPLMIISYQSLKNPCKVLDIVIQKTQVTTKIQHTTYLKYHITSFLI
jgi:hypothetical protein